MDMKDIFDLMKAGDIPSVIYDGTQLPVPLDIFKKLDLVVGQEINRLQFLVIKEMMDDILKEVEERLDAVMENVGNSGYRKEIEERMESGMIPFVMFRGERMPVIPEIFLKYNLKQGQEISRTERLFLLNSMVEFLEKMRPEEEEVSMKEMYDVINSKKEADALMSRLTKV